MIYGECNSDKTLVDTLGILSKEIRHASGKRNVCKQLEKDRNSKELVDETPWSGGLPKYIQKLKLLSS